MNTITEKYGIIKMVNTRVLEFLANRDYSIPVFNHEEDRIYHKGSEIADISIIHEVTKHFSFTSSKTFKFRVLPSGLVKSGTIIISPIQVILSPKDYNQFKEEKEPS